MSDIDPDRLYPFAEAAALIPSHRPGKRLHLHTLHRWRQRGLVKAVARQAGRMRLWFLPGSEVLRLSGADQVAALPRTAAARRRDQERLKTEWEELTQGRGERCRRNGARGAGGTGRVPRKGGGG